MAIESLRAQSRPVQSEREKQQVATISAHNEPAIGELVAHAIEKVGAEGAVTVEEAKGTETTMEVVEGLQFDRGYLSPYFVTDPEKMEVVLEDALILHLRRQDQQRQGFPAAARTDCEERVARCWSIAEDVDGEALATLVVNRLRGVFADRRRSRRPGSATAARRCSQDIAIVTGGQLVAQELGIKLENVTLEQLGRAARVVVDREHTTIIGGKGDKRAIDGRCQELRKQIADTTSDYDREKLEERLAKLSGGVAVIRVGAPVRSRDEEPARGVRRRHPRHAGGDRRGHRARRRPGAAARHRRRSRARRRALDGDERAGVLILRRALEAPARQIAENSGVDGGVVVDKMRAGTGNFGFDAAAGKYVDLVEAGIIDPTKVVRLALENAVSVAGVLLLTDATMTEVPDEKPAAGGPAMEGM